ncbi:hypothetical protein E4631_24485 [Hymenobacter sp. UV11]|uniref:nucleotidyl transferase AbiEii/AbiGii toxin family protein n=1 Tax=Hymenobacter sp. UV11 TaxID=1849735 RepID=UPI00105D21A8|nr:nucleotidyl transferase AbiEii/AbiGii toxin family protein [Hymenobacter sp. UV11]TDN35760.1 hypothetical protein A8B98_12580 [Hymenobacter sp. UV11]TFZ62793.1 hypothetical protein E4631_24485 [Hymenobacter sp. UV11]
MNDSLVDHLLAVCQVLNDHGVEYLTVGGTAVALYGYYRLSMNPAGVVVDKPDVDLWYNPTYGNYFKLLRALEALGQDVSAFRQEQAPNPKQSFFKYEFEQFTLDLLPELRVTLSFGASYRTREVLTLQDVVIPLISLDDLLADKAATARPKDLVDIAQLKANQKGGEK